MHLILCIMACLLSVSAIRVPVDGKDEQPPSNVGAEVNDQGSPETVYYTSNEGHVDSYLFPPDPHKTAEIYDARDEINTASVPASHLLPPTNDKKQIDYYFQPQKHKGGESDWLPLVKGPEIPKQVEQEKPADFKKSDYVIVNNPVVVPPELSSLEKEKLIFENPVQAPPNDEELTIKNIKQEVISDHHHIAQKNQFARIPVPSQHLEPPSIGALDEYSLSLPLKYGFPMVNAPNRLTPPPPGKILFDPNQKKKMTLFFEHNDKVPRLALGLTPPKTQKHTWVPTALHPKKYAPFHVIPIPIGPFVDLSDKPESGRPLGSLMPLGKKLVSKKYRGISKEKPSKPFQPYTSHKLPAPNEQKLLNIYQQEEEKRNNLHNTNQVNEPVTVENKEKSPEPVTSETNFGPSKRNPHQTFVKPIANTGANAAAASAPNERTEFRMHGMKGPHSYQFGYDTGKGKNRQFRYEERDNDGHVRGHYGYVDKHGKMRVVNYDADPKLGFRAEAPTDAEPK